MRASFAKVFVLPALALAFCTTACLPIKYTAKISPAFDGTYRHADGSPVTGRRVAISGEYDDSTCQHALVHATTDSSGAFLLAESHERRWVPLQTDLAMYGYHVCVGDTTSLRAVHWATTWIFTPGEDKLECFEWTWQGDQRVSCAAASDSAVVTGGSWQDAGGRSGWYRVFIGEQQRGASHVYVQWLSRADTNPNAPPVVDDIVELPCTDGWCRLASPHLGESNGTSTVDVRDPSSDAPRHTRRFELGAPGEVHEVESADPNSGSGATEL